MPGHVLYIAPHGKGHQGPAKRLADEYGLGLQVLEVTEQGKGDGGEKVWEKFVRLMRGASMILVWNGMQHRGGRFRDFAEANGIPIAYLEYGMLEQGDTYFVDPGGFNSRSVLCGQLSWVTPGDMKRLHDTREDLRRRLDVRDEGHVLVPLQIQKDTQILYHTPFGTMDEFVEYVVRLWPGARVVVRPHPKSGPKVTYDGATVDRSGTWMEACAKASAVVGITSTCLLEAAVLGKPVLALGRHPLSAHRPAEHDRVAAGALALRVNRESGRIAPVLERFGIRPLNAAPLGVSGA